MSAAKPRYSKAPFPYALFLRFNKLARKLGYNKRGERWLLLGKLLDSAEKYYEEFKHTPNA